MARPTSLRGRRPPVQRIDAGAALDLLDRAGATLLAACRAQTTTDRFITAQLGALRAGAALLAARPDVASSSVRIRNTWDAVTRVAPEMSEWAAYFALCGARRRDLEAGAVAEAREADDLLRAAETFLALVQAALGVPVTPLEPVLAVAGRA